MNDQVAVGLRILDIIIRTIAKRQIPKPTSGHHNLKTHDRYEKSSRGKLHANTKKN